VRADLPLLSRLLFFRSDRSELHDGFLRLARGFLRARAALALALVAAQALVQILNANVGWHGVTLCGLYALATLIPAARPAWVLVNRGEGLSTLQGRRWWATIGLDVLTFSVLQALDPNSSVPFAALYILPVLMSGVLAPRRLALAAAALSTLGLLGGSLWVGLLSPDWSGRWTGSGLAGIGYFAVALLSAELAERLAGEQRAAQGSRAYALQQSALNQLVIDELREGVLVLDRDGQVRAANPAARALLGERHPVPGSSFRLRGEAAWSELQAAVDRAWERGPQGLERANVALHWSSSPSRRLRTRLRFIRSADADGAEDLCLLLLEDHATLVARTRQEKLAAMGRMSASIAHEIRNPLSAISQANALLSEDLQADEAALRLATMVDSNVKRLQRIVDEVALLAAPLPTEAPSSDAKALVEEVCADWRRTQVNVPAEALALQCPEAPGWIQFDAEHLRRVLINLLDNAWRHASETPSPWLRVTLEASDERTVRLAVVNPGPPLDPEVERHLFEPFYSTRSRGSGLGLTICRELCERYGARIDYQAQLVDDKPAIAFVVSLRPTPEAAAESR
jgi:two-component system sensor histidine kinase PilS (NtrC family)